MQYTDNDLISVIVPVYRVEKYLEQCITSIINQTYTNLEIILVDDGSDDNSGIICDDFAKIDQRIKVIHKKNEGLDKARKSGFKIAKGSFIGYVDSDDWIEPQMYEILMMDALSADVDVVDCGIIDSWSDIEKNRKAFFRAGTYKGDKFDEEILPKILYSGDFFNYGIVPSLCNKLFKRDAIKEYQLFDNPVQELLNDNLVVFPTIINSRSLYIEEEFFYHYRVNNASLRHKVKKENIGLFYSIEDAFRTQLKEFLHIKEIERQIKIITLYYYLCRIPYIFDDAGEYLSLFGGVPADGRIILFGAGSVGMHLKAYLDEKGIEVVKWIDSRYSSFESSYGVDSPERVNSEVFDYVIVAVAKHSAAISIKQYLENLGIEEKKIKWIKQEYIDNPDLMLHKAYHKTYGEEM